MQSSSAAGSGQQIAIQAKIHTDTPAWQQVMLVAWCFTLLLPIDEFRLVRLGCLAIILALFAHYADRTVPLMMKAWPLLLYPVLGLISSGWSTYPSQAISEGVLLVLTPFILAMFSVRLRPTEFFRVMTFAGAGMTAYMLVQGGAPMHKQILAYHLLLAGVVALVTALNNEEAPVFRIVGVIVASIAFAMQLSAESATALILGILAITFLLGAKFVWVPMAQTMHLRSIVALTFLILILAVGLAIFSAPQNTFISDFLNLVGKDTTLTGRTVIWDTASDVVKEKPVLGHGLGGFWHPEVGRAQTLAELTHSAPGTNISFHSVYWESRVHLGWVGFACLGFAVAWALWIILAQWFRDASFINTGLLAMAVIVVTTVVTESTLAGPFNLMVTSFYFGALSSFDPGGRKVTMRATLRETEE